MCASSQVVGGKPYLEWGLQGGIPSTFGTVKWAMKICPASGESSAPHAEWWVGDAGAKSGTGYSMSMSRSPSASQGGQSLTPGSRGHPLQSVVETVMVPTPLQPSPGQPGSMTKQGSNEFSTEDPSEDQDSSRKKMKMNQSDTPAAWCKDRLLRGRQEAKMGAAVVRDNTAMSASQAFKSPAEAQVGSEATTVVMGSGMEFHTPPKVDVTHGPVDSSATTVVVGQPQFSSPATQQEAGAGEENGAPKDDDHDRSSFVTQTSSSSLQAQLDEKEREMWELRKELSEATTRVDELEVIKQQLKLSQERVVKAEEMQTKALFAERFANEKAETVERKEVAALAREQQALRANQDSQGGWGRPSVQDLQKEVLDLQSQLSSTSEGLSQAKQDMSEMRSIAIDSCRKLDAEIEQAGDEFGKMRKQMCQLELELEDIKKKLSSEKVGKEKALADLAAEKIAVATLQSEASEKDSTIVRLKRVYEQCVDFMNREDFAGFVAAKGQQGATPVPPTTGAAGEAQQPCRVPVGGLQQATELVRTFMQQSCSDEVRVIDEMMTTPDGDLPSFSSMADDDRAVLMQAIVDLFEKLCWEFFGITSGSQPGSNDRRIYESDMWPAVVNAALTTKVLYFIIRMMGRQDDLCMKNKFPALETRCHQAVLYATDPLDVAKGKSMCFTCGGRVRRDKHVNSGIPISTVPREVEGCLCGVLGPRQASRKSWHRVLLHRQDPDSPQ